MNVPTDHTDVLDVIVRMADAHHTYLSWIWMRDPFTQQAERIDAGLIAPLVAELDASLIEVGSFDERRDENATVRALTRGAFADLHTEQDLSWRLSRVMLPQRLQQQLREILDAGIRVRMRITPSPRCSRIPWELLMLDKQGPRLLELVDIVLDPPVTAHAGRSRLPAPWEQVRTYPAVHIVDPLLPSSARDAGLKQVLGAGSVLKERLKAAITADATVVEQRMKLPAIQSTFTRRHLSRALRKYEGGLSRLFYMGHVSSATDEPGSASLHLSDEYWNGTGKKITDVWGMSGPVRGNEDENNHQPAQPGDHMPLSALDLLLGTTDVRLDTETTARVWDLYETGKATYGHELWPMPPRVAMIACEGGADFRSSETFGLVMAMVDAGAEIVTTTRWPLPTDYAIQQVTGSSEHTPTTDLAVTVDHAHSQDEPLTEIRTWQREQLQRWQNSGAIEHTPLVWASVTSTVAPDRSDTVIE
uniref:Uncharacterized protein n=1 Tax=Rhodococcus sp. NS1 TaxID=402236 RepID=Q06G89_9NOCA|nr:CHAT domain-containing protein [Rhodococcus sp. NS1]ABI79422.1 hypothetical protein PNSL1.094 [Rhodococcus sp. NS1]